MDDRHECDWCGCNCCVDCWPGSPDIAQYGCGTCFHDDDPVEGPDGRPLYPWSLEKLLLNNGSVHLSGVVVA